MAVAKKKTAPAKKKAVATKGAWTPPWAKKAVAEKKTGEKYASKAEMAKHEKGETKKVRAAEGEIKKFGDGGGTTPADLVKRAPATYNPYTVKKPTADSTLYYTQKEAHFREGIKANLKEGRPLGALKSTLARNKAANDRIRQRNKGKQGYDDNGYPIKATKADMYKKGGKTTAKKKVATYKKGGKKC